MSFFLLKNIESDTIMKKLFLTFGTPAIGKSTFIKKHNLSSYTIEIDKLREVYSATNRVLSDDNKSTFIKTTQDQDGFIWKLAYEIIESKMSQNKTIIVDATFLFPNALDQPFELAKKYGYKIEIIDFMSEIVAKLGASEKNQDPLIDYLQANDKKRHQDIPRYVFERYSSRYFSSLSINKGTKITPDEFVAKYLTPLKPIDLNQFNRIKVIGDVHGDHSSLLLPFQDHKKGDAYVFVGDYLDRGSKNYETFKMLQSLKGKNLFFLEGNHEQHLRNVSHGLKVTSFEFKTKTLPELMTNNVTFDEIQEFTKRLLPYLYFTFDNQKFMVTHAGLEPMRLHDFETAQTADESIAFADESEFTNGLAQFHNDPYNSDVDMHQTESKLTTIQIHGHRNVFEHSVQVSENAYNINGASNTDDSFRYLVIEK